MIRVLAMWFVLALIGAAGVAKGQTGGAGTPPSPVGAPTTPGGTEAPDTARPLSAEVTVTAAIEPESALLGDVFSLVVTVTRPADAEVRPPGKPALGDAFRVRGLKRATAPADGGLVTETLTYDIVAVRKGKLRIQPFEVPLLRGEQATTVKTPRIKLSVKSRMASEVAPELRSAGAPLPLQERNWPLIWTLSGLGIALVAAGLALLAVKILGPRLRGALPPPPPRPAHEIAYERLAALREQGLSEAGAFKDFYLELSEIVRQYFGNRYDIPALGETSTELLEVLRKLRPKGIQLEEVEAFLGESDLVKFAKLTPSRNDMEAALVSAQLFVDRTREEARERQEKKPDAPKLPAAPLNKRVFGAMLDATIAAVLGTIPLVIAERTGAAWVAWLAAAVTFAYVLLRDLPRRGSIGKMLAGTELAPAAPRQPEPSAGHRIRRNLSLAIPLAGAVAEVVWVSSDPEKLRMGDRWARTRVVDSRPDQGQGTALAGSVGCALVLGVLALFLVRLYGGG